MHALVFWKEIFPIINKTIVLRNSSTSEVKRNPTVKMKMRVLVFLMKTFALYMDDQTKNTRSENYFYFASYSDL